MTGSLIYATTLAPVLSDLIMRRRRRGHSGDHHEPLVVRLLMKPYRPVVRFLVHRRWVAVGVAAMLLAIGVLVFPRLARSSRPSSRRARSSFASRWHPRSRWRRASRR